MSLAVNLGSGWKCLFRTRGAPSATLVPPEGLQIKPTGEERSSGANLLFSGSSRLYMLLLLAVAAASGGYGARHLGIFNCQASGYGSDGYLSYCGATSYGDYDHGAMWFGLEPAAASAAANARLLFLGNSRTQFAFSTKATADWFSSISKSYYLLGFSHFENNTFELPLLRKLRPQAKAYVINIDSFFERNETGPGRAVMQDDSARGRYDEKRLWQGIHKASCGAIKALCGHSEAIFRARSSGAWVVTGDFTSEVVSYSENPDQDMVTSYTSLGRQVLTRLPVNPSCIILTVVPTVKTEVGTARAVATALGSDLIEPKLNGLVTFDGVHLDATSAEQWSAAFFDKAGPRIQHCLSE